MVWFKLSTTVNLSNDCDIQFQLIRIILLHYYFYRRNCYIILLLIRYSIIAISTIDGTHCIDCFITKSIINYKLTAQLLLLPIYVQDRYLFIIFRREINFFFVFLEKYNIYLTYVYCEFVIQLFLLSGYIYYRFKSLHNEILRQQHGLLISVRDDSLFVEKLGWLDVNYEKRNLSSIKHLNNNNEVRCNVYVK